MENLRHLIKPSAAARHTPARANLQLTVTNLYVVCEATPLPGHYGAVNAHSLRLCKRCVWGGGVEGAHVRPCPPAASLLAYRTCSETAVECTRRVVSQAMSLHYAVQLPHLLLPPASLREAKLCLVMVLHIPSKTVDQTLPP